MPSIIEPGCFCDGVHFMRENTFGGGTHHLRTTRPMSTGTPVPKAQGRRLREEYLASVARREVTHKHRNPLPKLAAKDYASSDHSSGVTVEDTTA